MGMPGAMARAALAAERRLPCAAAAASQLVDLRAFGSQAPAAPGGAEPVAPFAYCVQQVRGYDREDYVWIGQSRQAWRAPLFALHAFNVETALIPDQVSQLQLAQLRFQWWREAVDGMRPGQQLRHPVIQALTQVLGDAPVARYRLQRMISAREADFLREVPPNSLAALEQYADDTAAQLQALQLEVAGVRNQDADHAASHLGKAVGISLLLRGTAHHAAKRRSHLPVDLMAQEGVSQESLYRGEQSEGLQNVVFQVASTAKGHLEEARRLAPRLPPEARELMLAGVSAGLFLRALEKADFRVFTPALAGGGYSPLRHLLHTKWHALRRTF